MSWTHERLAAFLDKKEIPSDSYSFCLPKDDAFCIVKDRDMWLVYFSERGHRDELAWGKTEAQALNILKLFLLEAFKKN